MVTSALLLLGMVLKDGTGTTSLGMRLFGLPHGVGVLAWVLVPLPVRVR